MTGIISDVYNIFYADDDNDDREIFIDAISEISGTVNVTTNRNGDELIKVLQTPPAAPAIIFLDLNMPVKNGYEVLKEIKESTEICDIPVVILSTANDASAINTTRLLGASLYITKPNSFKALIKAIQYSLSINWKTFATSGKDFVYHAI